jgi:hypothetical protein
MSAGRITAPGSLQIVPGTAPPLRLQIMAEDGTELARFEVTDGVLDVTGSEDRWTEAAQRFITELKRGATCR